MKQFVLLVLVIALSACSDENQSKSDFKQATINILPVASSVTSSSNVEMALATVSESGVLSTPSISGVTVSPILNPENNALNNDTIIKWAKLDKDSKVEFVLPIQLEDGENAFVAKIDRFQGRNDMYGAYLVRPSLKEVKEVRGSVMDIHSVPNLNNDSMKLVLIDTGASGQGDEGYEYLLVYFNGWEMIVLRDLNVLDSGACLNFPDSGDPCTRNQVKWDFLTEKNDLILQEMLIVAEWKNPNDCKVPSTKTVSTYRIKDMKLSTDSSSKTMTTLEIDPVCLSSQSDNGKIHKKKKKNSPG